MFNIRNKYRLLHCVNVFPELSYTLTTLKMPVACSSSALTASAASRSFSNEHGGKLSKHPTQILLLPKQILIMEVNKVKLNFKQ